MTASALRLILPGLTALALTSALHAQPSAPTAAQLSSWISIRQQRVDLLREEIKEIDDRIESRLGVLLETLKSISDSKDSRTKVARMKEDTGKRLAKSIEYYDQKRSALKEELRNPRLHLKDEEKRKMIAAFDERIEKRTKQILDLYKSMPAHEDHERYKATGGGWYGTEYERNQEFEQNRRITSHSNTQRDAIVKHLDSSIARLEWHNRTLKSQIAAASPADRKTLSEEYARNEALIAERRQQKLETLTPANTPTHTVALKEAMDLDKALQTAVVELRREFTTMFQRYNTYLNELSSLHATESALAAAQPRS
jgi:hypothetical protein